MKYKKGDKVRIKTWDEMIQEFGVEIIGIGNYAIPVFDHYHFFKKHEDEMPPNRIVTICVADKRHFGYQNKYGEYESSFYNTIKGYAGEYYLQQIKDEL